MWSATKGGELYEFIKNSLAPHLIPQIIRPKVRLIQCNAKNLSVSRGLTHYLFTFSEKYTDLLS